MYNRLHIFPNQFKKLETSPSCKATKVDDISRRLFVFDKKTNLRFLIDTGAEISVVPYTYFKNNSIKSNIELCAANGGSISTYGNTNLIVDLGLKKHFKHQFIIASVENPIIGADFLFKYGLILDMRHRKLIDIESNHSVHCISKTV